MRRCESGPRSRVQRFLTNLQLGEWDKDVDTDRVGSAGTAGDLEEPTGLGDLATVVGTGHLDRGVPGMAGVIEVMGRRVQGTAGAGVVMGRGDPAGVGTGTDLS